MYSVQIVFKTYQRTIKGIKGISRKTKIGSPNNKNKNKNNVLPPVAPQTRTAVL